MKIAIVGTGIAGLSAAWSLNQRHDITVYEKDARIGGHSHTVDVDYDGRKIAVDTGFIVYNHLNYPNLTALFSHLNVPTKDSNMSLSVATADGTLEWRADTLSGVFAQKRNLANFRFLWMLRTILRFNHCALRDLDGGALDNMPLGAYLDREKFGAAFRSYYLLPMTGAIWSTSCEDILDFPAATLFRFLDNHRLLSFDKPIWRTVCGGSRSYVTRLCAPFMTRIRLGCGVKGIRREDDGVVVEDTFGNSNRYDHVVLGCHSDQSLALLEDADDQERAILGAMPYSSNRVYVHRDTDLMPKRRSAWASWNTLSDSVSGRMSVTYWMNLLQSIAPETPLFVSMNPPRKPRADLTFRVMDYEHPLFDLDAVAAQKRLTGIQGTRRTWFCGAYTGYGFHEDGLKSGLDVAERLGAPLRPWSVAPSNMDPEPETDTEEAA